MEARRIAAGRDAMRATISEPLHAQSTAARLRMLSSTFMKLMYES